MIVVSNTSPIINLAAIGKLDLLKKCFGKVYIPPAVYNEITIKGSGEPGDIEVRTFDWIEVVEVKETSLYYSSEKIWMMERPNQLFYQYN